MRKPVPLFICILSMLFVLNCGTNSNNSDDNTSVTIRLPEKQADVRRSQTTASITGNAIINDTGRYTIPDDIETYEIRLFCEECSYDETKTADPGDKVVFSWLFEGTYTMEVIAANSSNTAIFGGTTDNITVVPLTNTQAKVVITCLTRCRVNSGCDPAKPANLATQVNSENEIALTWEDSSDDEDGFIILRRYGNEGDFEEIARLGANEQSFVDATVTYSSVDPLWYLIKSYRQITEKTLCTSFPVSAHLPDGTDYLYDLADWGGAYWQ